MPISSNRRRKERRTGGTGEGSGWGPAATIDLGHRFTHSRIHAFPHSRIVRLEYRQERLLRDLDLADLLHALLPLRLLGEKLALAGDVAAVAFRRHVLA